MARTEIYGGVRDEFGIREGENIQGFTPEEEKLWQAANGWQQREEVMGQRDERRLREHKEREEAAWQKSRAGELLKRLGEAFEAYREYVAQDPEAQEKGLEFDAVNQKIFNRMRITVERANNAPRCRYEKANGTTCRAPRVRGKKYCHMHLIMEEARPEKIKLPSLVDANGIHAAIAKGAQAVVDGKLEQKQASILGYYLQLALSNVGRVNFENTEAEQMIEEE